MKEPLMRSFAVFGIMNEAKPGPPGRVTDIEKLPPILTNLLSGVTTTGPTLSVLFTGTGGGGAMATKLWSGGMRKGCAGAGLPVQSTMPRARADRPINEGILQRLPW